MRTPVVPKTWAFPSASTPTHTLRRITICFIMALLLVAVPGSSRRMRSIPGRQRNCWIGWQREVREMKNFSNSDDTGSFLNVRARLLKKMRATNVSEQIEALLHETFETMLEAENMSISKLEKKVLMA